MEMYRLIKGCLPPLLLVGALLSCDSPEIALESCRATASTGPFGSTRIQVDGRIRNPRDRPAHRIQVEIVWFNDTGGTAGRDVFQPFGMRSLGPQSAADFSHDLTLGRAEQNWQIHSRYRCAIAGYD